MSDWSHLNSCWRVQTWPGRALARAQMPPTAPTGEEKRKKKTMQADNYTKNLPVSAGSRKEAEPAISWKPSPLVRCTFTSRSHVLVLLSYHFANFCHIASGLLHANYVWMWAQPGSRWIKKLEELANLNLATEATGRSIVVFAGTLQLRIWWWRQRILFTFKSALER